MLEDATHAEDTWWHQGGSGTILNIALHVAGHVSVAQCVSSGTMMYVTQWSRTCLDMTSHVFFPIVDDQRMNWSEQNTRKCINIIIIIIGMVK